MPVLLKGLLSTLILKIILNFDILISIFTDIQIFCLKQLVDHQIISLLNDNETPEK